MAVTKNIEWFREANFSKCYVQSCYSSGLRTNPIALRVRESRKTQTGNWDSGAFLGGAQHWSNKTKSLGQQTFQYTGPTNEPKTLDQSNRPPSFAFVWLSDNNGVVEQNTALVLYSVLASQTRGASYSAADCIAYNWVTLKFDCDMALISATSIQNLEIHYHNFCLSRRGNSTTSKSMPCQSRAARYSLLQMTHAPVTP